MKIAKVMRTEPRYRGIEKINSKQPLMDFQPGSADYAHVYRYVFAADLLKSSKNLKILNIASGSGYGSKLLFFNGNIVVGGDLYMEPLSKSMKNFSKNIFLKLNVENMSCFKSSSFDVVVSFKTIEHVFHPEKAVIEMKNVVKNQGLVIGSIPIDIYHNPGTTFSFKDALKFIDHNFTNSELWLQDNWRMYPFSKSNWKTVRMQGDKYFIFKYEVKK
ncbi:MAG TPA: class I SAM-dependent methyltransferase [Nitrospinota bacterium]|nr:class I SAM-dependent methyltransferase [Nitrospinota bacterium]